MMKTTTDNIELRLAQMRDVHCPHKVDVTDRVMAAIASQPASSKVRPLRPWYRYAAVVAACVAALFAVNLTLLYTRSFDKAQIGSLISDVYSYDVADVSAIEESSFSQAWFEQI